jgi:predicted NBD/HSP70 family sugar kinase
MDRRRDQRWRGALDVLAVVRRRPGITRAELARLAGVSSGSATDIAARLRGLSLLHESPAPAAGRGRPTTMVGAHPRGPLVAAIDLRYEDWRLALAGVDGRLERVAAERHRRREPRAVLAAIADALAEVRARHGRRVRAVSLAVSGTVQDHQLVQAATMRWGKVDLGALAGRPALPVLVGNDATLAGVAEARGGAGADARAVLHLIVEVGIGGILVVDGQPVAGATGAGGEFGHLPFGDRRLRCPCGARGCWDLLVDGRAMARELGEPPPTNARTYARLVIDRAAHDRAARRAVAACAAALGRGVAGLVNALDPDVVTLGALAIPVHDTATTAFRQAYHGGLMRFRRDAPPPVRTAVHGDDGALQGAAEVGLDAVITEGGLDAWTRDLDA